MRIFNAMYVMENTRAFIAGVTLLPQEAYPNDSELELELELEL